MKRKSILSAALALAAMMFFTPMSANAAVSDWEKPHEAVLTSAELEALSDEEREAYSSSLIQALGYVESEEEAKEHARYSLNRSGSLATLNQGTHSSLYDPRKQNLGYKLPAIRNQNPYGTCWAHAATACLEIDLIKNHNAPSTINLSELQLANSAYFHSGNDPLGGLVNDNYYITNFNSDIGGNDTLAYNTLSMRVGLVDENEVPAMAYNNMYNYCFKKLPSEYVYKNQYGVLDNFYVMEYPTMDDIKSAIEKYGAVKVSYYHDFSSAANGKNGAFKNPSNKGGTNHAVCIVGWDDNYPKENFNSQPENNGAWIVRNSWGTYMLDEGYMYMSYEEYSASRFAVYDGNIASQDYPHVYQYDSMPYNNRYYPSNPESANIFTAVADENIGAVMVRGEYESGCKYTVRVFTGVDASNPSSGTLAATKTGTFTTDSTVSVTTFELDKPVPVKKGEKFSVCVSYDGGRVYYDSATTVSFGSFNLVQEPSCRENVSFFNFGGNGFTVSTQYNVCIKALGGKKSASQPEVKVPGAFKISLAESHKDGVILKWTKSANAKGYKIYKDNKVIKTISGTSTLSFVDKTAKSKEGKLSTYKVLAYNGSKTKASSNTLKATYLKATKIASAKNTDKGKVLVSYSKNSKATGYELVYSYKKNLSSAKKVTSKGTSIKLTKLKKGKTVYIKVRPYKTISNKKYYGPYTAVKSVKIKK